MSTEPIKLDSKLHQKSWQGLWFTLVRRKTFRKPPFIVSMVASLAIMTVLYIFNFDNSLDIVGKTSELILSFFPDLLGFTLGGFAIVVGFSNADLIKRGASPKKLSVYQILNAIFAYCIIVQVVVVVIAFIVSWCITNDISTIIEIHSQKVCNWINFVILAVMIFGSLFTLLLTPTIVINLFTLSQLNNLFYTVQEMPRFKAEEAKRVKEQEAEEKGATDTPVTK